MKIRKELWFGFILMAIILAGTAVMLLSAEKVTNGHLGLMMLALVVVAIMMGFPTAFTLMGMGMIFTWIAYERDTSKTLTLMVQSAFKVMSNDVLISIPLFVFMGYLVERANLIEKLFRSLHLAMARVPGSLAVATLLTCAVFATATGIVGAVVTLMGLLAFPQMLRAGYDTRLAAGAITAGGCLGILIPPSVMLIVYGATAGVSVVQLYAGALFPGLMLAGLYIIYVIIVAYFKPHLAPPLPEAERHIDLPALTQKLLANVSSGVKTRAVPALLTGMRGERNNGVPMGHIARQLGIALLPLIVFTGVSLLSYRVATSPVEAEAPVVASTGMQSLEEKPAETSSGGLQEPPSDDKSEKKESSTGLAEPPSDDKAEKKEASSGLAEPPGAAASEPAAAKEAAQTTGVSEPPGANAKPAADASAGDRVPAPKGYWIGLAVGAAVMLFFYAWLSFARLEIFKMLLSSFFPLVVLILAVLGSIVFGLATPTEAAAVGALGGALLAAAYGRLNFGVVKESAFLTAKTSAMVCWLFVGSAIFSAAFALLGGQELVENWVMSMNLTKFQFLLLSQAIIFILGWPLEWTEIIVIFMPIFIPLLDNFGVDPLFFGLLVALNLQTAFLSPPVAMAAFYLKGVSPPHVTLNQIFAGMLPFMGIQVLAIVILYAFPQIGMWLPTVLYR
ncbi:TRAP transporter large permease subunit [Variovorax sp. PCZ-1]|uniref:TRAP transporter large permease n=1 Tax=Variovorax sp. PCZ-1 TaxID=2835533 RepID=UPI001BCDA081|nr:TRAP transporter large permease subunit [Variovorax sp. PCZ-1]MBS7807878.1 TRAP transporter large permease subunit [Variovorax sp. PCZ-1]